MTSPFRIAACQIDVKYGALAGNLQAMQEQVHPLASQGVFLIAFPECSLSGYCCQSIDEAREIAVERDSRLIDQAAHLARDCGVNLVFGFLERQDQRVLNTAALVTRGGQRHFYHKVHLPMLGVDQFTTAGCEYPVVEVEGLRIGLNICYDCSFPEPARILALAGADLIVLPTNWPPGTETTAQHIPNARAIENNVYFMAVNRVGDERGFHFIGKSKICDPAGHDLAFADHDRPQILVAEIDASIARNKHLVRVPGKHEVDRLADRRPETYTAITRPIKIP